MERIKEKKSSKHIKRKRRLQKLFPESKHLTQNYKWKLLFLHPGACSEIRTAFP